MRGTRGPPAAPGTVACPPTGPAMPDPWNPTEILRVDQFLDTSMGTLRVRTDAGPAFLKAMGGNRNAGPHPLACEWVGTKLADRLGLTVCDHALIDVNRDLPLVSFADGRPAEAGPAFVSRAADAFAWGGDAKVLEDLVNPQDVAGLAVFDTWTRNCDRHLRREGGSVRRNFGNVMLENLPDGLRLLALDQSCCFTCDGPLTPKLAHIGSCKDRTVFGLFPGFAPLISERHVDTACDRLAGLDDEFLRETVGSIPVEWGSTIGPAVP